MKKIQKIVLSVTLALAANTVMAQEAAVLAVLKNTSEVSNVSTDAETWAPLPKKKTSKREQQIIDKVTKAIKTQFESTKDSFLQLDKDNNDKLDSSEISQLLKRAKINGFTRVIAASRLIDRYDRTEDSFVDWREYEFAVNKAIEKAAEKAKKSVEKE